jgi:hypothetical protein
VSVELGWQMGVAMRHSEKGEQTISAIKASN